MSQLLQTIGSPVRLKIIHFLAQAPHSVEQLSLKLGESVANTSMHLKKMERQHILKNESQAQKRIYSFNHDELNVFWEQILNWTKIASPETFKEFENFYGDDFIWKEPLKLTVQLIKEKKVVVVDLRPSEEVSESQKNEESYKKYITSLPYPIELKQKLNKLKTFPKTKPILLICRGALCVMSQESCFQLRSKGFNSYNFNISWQKISKLLE
jgi:DNA-binding transcriptional ArsR family regulator